MGEYRQISRHCTVRRGLRPLIAVPVYNEAASIGRVIEAIRPYATDILVVDDGSTDETPARLDELADIQRIRHSINLGYGRSLIDAFDHAHRGGYDWVVTLDADEQHEPALIPRFLAAAACGDADIVSGSRYLQSFSHNTSAPSDRRRINHVVTDVLNSVLGLGLTDAFCGFKAHRVSAMRQLELSVNGYAFPLQFWVQAAHAGLRVREVAVPLIYNDPNRHFGGSLDSPCLRLRHYLDVLAEALQATGRARLGAPALAECAGL